MEVSTLFFLLLGTVVVVAVFRLVRNLRLREKYAALWLATGVVVILLMLFPRVLDHIAGWVGVATPVNLLFLIAIMLLLGVCLHLSLEISRLEDETRILAEEAAIQRTLLDRYLDPNEAPISEPKQNTGVLPRVGEQAAASPSGHCAPDQSPAHRREPNDPNRAEQP